MALGFTTSSAFGSRAILPDKGLSASFQPRVLTAQFGDGYQQRVLDGINNSPRSFGVSFNTRTKAEIDDIAGYFNSLSGVTKFNFNIPDSNEGVVVNYFWSALILIIFPPNKSSKFDK